jgi:3-oxoacyl-[acyl-carrier-protein] synthase-3
VGIYIREIEYYLPPNKVTNKELQQLHPNWDMEKVFLKTGVLNRHLVTDETAYDLAKKAVEQLFLKNLINKSEIDGIIFCTQSPDYIMPSNAFLIHKDFSFNHKVWAFDYNLACSGFIYGLAIARGMIETGMAKNILLINADTYSKYINHMDRSTAVLFGDGASVVVLSACEDTKGVIDITLSASGNEFNAFYIPAGGCRLPKNELTSIDKSDITGNKKSLENIHMDGQAVWRFISKIVPSQIEEILQKNSLSINFIDQFIFHQASKLTIDSLIKELGIEIAKVYMNIERIGNTVSASIPIALCDAINDGRVKKGDIILLSGFGVGLSWGSALIKF